MKYVLITGISSGIGYATAKYLLDKGYFVFGSVRKEADSKRLRNEFSQNFKALEFDVTDPAGILHAAEEVKAICGEEGLAGLINNAGIAVSGPLQHIPLKEVAHQMDVNVMGALRVTQALLPLLGAQKPAVRPPGKIINISSISGRFTSPFLGPYCASKHALESLSDALRRELMIYGIDVIVLQPGPVKTPIWDKASEQNNPYPGTDYAPILAHNEKIIRKAEARGIEPERIARQIHRVLTMKRPKTRYILAAGSWKYHLLFRLPDRLMDYLIRKNFERLT